MSADSTLRIASLCVVLACAETLHGIARTLMVVPRIGKDRAIKLSALTGSVLALVICCWLVSPIGLQGVLQNLVFGLAFLVMVPNLVAALRSGP